MKKQVSASNKFMKIYDWIEFLAFIIIGIVVLYIAFTKDSSEICPPNTQGNLFSTLLSAFCNYGTKGMVLFLIAVALFCIGCAILIKAINKNKRLK